MREKIKHRILYIIEQLGLGGAERQLYYLCAGIKNRFDLIIVTYNSEELDYLEALCSMGVEVIVIKKKRGILGRLGFVISLIKLIRELSPDLIQTWLVSANFWGRIAILFSGISTCNITSIRNVDTSISKLEIYADRFLSSITDCYIANSYAAKNFMTGYGISEDKIRVIHNGIDPEKYNIRENKTDIQREISIPAGRIVIGTVGRMYPQKNHEMLIDAAKEVICLNSEIHFVIVGNGELRKQLETKIEEYNLQNYFTLLGNRNDIDRILKAFDIFVFTSLWEGFPNAIMEAMCAKLPIIATNVGGVPELIRDGSSGLLIEINDQKALMNWLIELSSRPDLRNSLGQAAFDSIGKEFSLSKMVVDTVSIYDKLLKLNQ